LRQLGGRATRQSIEDAARPTGRRLAAERLPHQRGQRGLVGDGHAGEDERQLRHRMSLTAPRDRGAAVGAVDARLRQPALERLFDGPAATDIEAIGRLTLEKRQRLPVVSVVERVDAL
jgi:hypothetical protein